MPGLEWQRGYSEGAQATRNTIVKALREQAECYPAGSPFAHTGDAYRNAAEFIETLYRFAPRETRLPTED